MPNSNKRRGTYFEGVVRSCAVTDGCKVIRPGGSLGSADLIVFAPTRLTYAVQCKVSDWPGPAERAALAEWWYLGVEPWAVRRDPTKSPTDPHASWQWHRIGEVPERPRVDRTEPHGA